VATGSAMRSTSTNPGSIADTLVVRDAFESSIVADVWRNTPPGTMRPGKHKYGQAVVLAPDWPPARMAAGQDDICLRNRDSRIRTCRTS
jgi:hypothetical protein